TDPVQDRNAAYEVELVFGKVEQNNVADDIAIVVDGYELLGLVDGEIVERVDTKIARELQRVRTFNSEIGHVIGLVEEHAGVLPGPLFVAPVGEFCRNAGINVWSRLLVAKKMDRVAAFAQHVLERSDCHHNSSLAARSPCRWVLSSSIDDASPS